MLAPDFTSPTYNLNVLAYLAVVTLMSSKEKLGPTIQLGKNGAAELTARVVYGVFDPVGIDDISIEFQAKRHGKVLHTKRFHAGISSGGCTDVLTGQYIGTKRKQFIVRLHHGRVATYLLDFDGKQVKTVYKVEDGRHDVVPMRDHKGRFYVRDSSPGWGLGENGEQVRYVFTDHVYFDQNWKPIHHRKKPYPSSRKGTKSATKKP